MVQKAFIMAVVLLMLMGMAAYAEASEQQVIMGIEGMTCELCAVAVKKSLSGIDGVRDVRISFVEKKAWLTADESVSDEKLIEAVRKAGPYTGKIIERK
jgi:mercuric ion binding protein